MPEPIPTWADGRFLAIPSAAPAQTDVLGAANRQVSATRWALVQVTMIADSSGTTAAEVSLLADLDDDGNEEPIADALAQAGLAQSRRAHAMFLLPPGATYSVTNDSDPEAGNSATAYEIELEV